MIRPLRPWLWGLLALVATACVEDPSPKNEGETDEGVIADATPDAAPDAAIPDAAVPDMAVLPPDMGGMSCMEDVECGPGGTCADGVCQPPECRMDGDCPAPMLQACRDFVCRDRCLGNNCIRGGICIDGACVPEQCVVDGDCAEGELCRGGRCVEAQPCENNAECAPDGRCIDGNCEPLTICAGDRNCAADEICVEGRCQPQPTCEARADCGEGEDCVGARCVPFVCRGEGDCPEGEVCRAGACAAPVVAEVAEVVITRPRSLDVNATLQLRAVGLDERGDIVAVAGFEWAAEGAGAVDDAGLLTAGAAAGEVSVTAAYAAPRAAS
ncbi:MAG: hypothetical protein R3F60_15035 [bacterium]